VNLMPFVDRLYRIPFTRTKTMVPMNKSGPGTVLNKCPFKVISGHRIFAQQCPVSGAKQTSIWRASMSANSQEPTTELNANH